MFNDVLLGLSKKTKEDGEVSIYINLNVELIKRGILQDLTGNEMKVLLAIASFMNEGGECTPAQERIASMTNLASSTVSLAVNSIIRKKIDGKVLMKRKFIGSGSKKY
jgi:DNA-binding MarR family transcriptional regulator